MTAHLITCRYGKTWNCCCWVCYNRSCSHPKNEVLPDCKTVCELFTKTPYCKRSNDNKKD